MTTKSSLPVIDTNSSKAEEIEFLHNIVDTCKPGSYLGSFFSPNLVKWLQEQITNDFSTDLFNDWYQAQIDEAVKTDNNRRQEIQGLTRDLEDYKAIVAQFKDEVVPTLERENNSMRQQVDALSASLSASYSEVNDCENKIIQLESHIDALRMRIFKMEHPDL